MSLRRRVLFTSVVNRILMPRRLKNLTRHNFDSTFDSKGQKLAPGLSLSESLRMDERFASTTQRFGKIRESWPKANPGSISRPPDNAAIGHDDVEQQEERTADAYGSAWEDVPFQAGARQVCSDDEHLTPPPDQHIPRLPQRHHSKLERKSSLEILNDGCAVAYESGLMRQYHSPFVLHQSDCDPCQASPEDVDATDRFCYDCCESGHWSADCSRKMATDAVWVGPDADEDVA